MTLASLRESVLVKGSQGLEALGWDAQWRAGLVDQLETLCGHLWSVGITEIFVDGSFVTDKAHPGDIDGYFICEFDRFCKEQFPELLSLVSQRFEQVLLNGKIVRLGGFNGPSE